MGTLTETVPSRAVRARRGNRGLATALHLDLAYLLGDGAMQSFASVLLAPVFSIMFNGGAFVDGFGFRLGIVMAVFSPAMMVLTVPLIDMQSGYRLRGLAPASPAEPDGLAVLDGTGSGRVRGRGDCIDRWGAAACPP